MVLFNFKKNNPGWQGFSRKISWKQLKIYYNFLKKIVCNKKYTCNKKCNKK